MTQQCLSILVPMYNEEESIPHFFPAMGTALGELDLDYRIICVDDGSSDKTLELLKAEAAKDNRIQVIALSRNFGKEAAMTAALDYARGDAVLPIDADLQDPPKLIGQMIEKWREGFEVVYAQRISRASETVIKRRTAAWFYKLFNRMCEIDIPENVGDFRLMDKKVVDAIKRLPEKDRFMKGLFCWPGFKSTIIEFDHQSRVKGKTKFSYWKLWNLALSGILSFSTFPIRMGVYLGLFVSCSAFFYGAYTVIKTLVTGVDVPGYASLLVVMLFLGGVQLFFMGLIGEYIGRIFMEVKNRPIYLVAEEIGFEDDKKH